MATLSSILAWRIPWTEESGELQSMGSHSQTRLKWLSTTYTQTHTHILNVKVYISFSKWEREYAVITSQKAWKIQADRSIERGPGKPQGWGVQTAPHGRWRWSHGEHVRQGERPAQPGLETIPRSRLASGSLVSAEHHGQGRTGGSPEPLSALLGSQPWARGRASHPPEKVLTVRAAPCEPRPEFAPVAMSPLSHALKLHGLKLRPQDLREALHLGLGLERGPGGEPRSNLT